MLLPLDCTVSSEGREHHWSVVQAASKPLHGGYKKVSLAKEGLPPVPPWDA